jgi:hypothetical protein
MEIASLFMKVVDIRQFSMKNYNKLYLKTNFDAK